MSLFYGHRPSIKIENLVATFFYYHTQNLASCFVSAEFVSNNARHREQRNLLYFITCSFTIFQINRTLCGHILRSKIDRRIF